MAALFDIVPGEAPEPIHLSAGEPSEARAAQCDAHGPYIARDLMRGPHRNPVWSRCPTCMQEKEAEQRAQEEQKAAHQHAEQRRWLLSQCGAVGRFGEASFDSFQATTTEQQRVRAACRTFASDLEPDSGAGLILIGPPGTGKTLLLNAIVRHVAGERGMRSLVITARDLVRRVRATWRHRSWEPDVWGNRPETEEGVIEQLGSTTHLLALDEVGASFGTEAEQTLLLDVIDMRYRLRRPTVVASNLALPAMRNAIGERSFDRLRDGAKVLLCTWPSHRGQA